MARSNKYASLNFNDIYEKKVINSGNSNTRPHSSSPFSSSPSASSAAAASSPNKTIISNSRIHGHMLVLSRPTPKPIAIPQKPDPSTESLAPPRKVASSDIKSTKVADQTGSEPDSISLRPQGRTGSGSPIVLSPAQSPGNPNSPLGSPLLKSDRFVPPHLRPGFVGREERPGPEFVKGGQGRGRGQLGSPNRYGEDGRPKSGGGCERMRRNAGEADPVDVLNRPGSSGARPSSSGGRYHFIDHYKD
ncbi:hypothetical protein M9H77_21079 [Catharanthus roseus]|uniref:Uncharacterized protein n=1 Tax=Catharanthus roseus TaxID=4058 RepID=A0ACC0AQJ4_CATRO|nr:hypothetical protein M9H77_21079 [Catharanthus roseus]